MFPYSPSIRCFNLNATPINLNEQLMEEVRDHISESMKALERKMRSELRLMVQDPSLGGGGGRGSITGGTGTHCILYYSTVLYCAALYCTAQCSQLLEFTDTVF